MTHAVGKCVQAVGNAGVFHGLYTWCLLADMSTASEGYHVTNYFLSSSSYTSNKT